jgi:hypothetical protein
MDEVTYNAAGNEVTLVKRRAPVEVQAAHHTSAEPALCH